MSRTLTLVQTGWEFARATADRGHRVGALAQLERVLARPDVPAGLAAEAHRLAGELALDLGRYATARRHLKASAALDAANATTRFLQGRAWEEDPDGCDRRAAIGYKKAAALDPANPLYRAAFGRAAARCGKVKCGASEMLAAAEAAPGNVEVVRVAVQGLLEVCRAADAHAVIAKARFARPNDAELAGLSERVKFEAARLSQQTAAKLGKRHAKTRYAQDAQFATDGDRVTLPFLRIAGTTGHAGATGGGVVRRDSGSSPRPHLARLRARKADR